MDNLLQKIIELVEAYNGLPNAKKMALIEEELIKDMNIPKKEDFKDVSDFYIGVYNEGQVGLFREMRYCSPKTEVMGHEKWSAGSLFIGVESNLISIKITHDGFNSRVIWQPEGEIELVDQKRYVCNCNMKDAVPFDNVRLMMYEEGKIPAYTLGKATQRQIVETLSYAKNYYEGKIIMPTQKTK